LLFCVAVAMPLFKVVVFPALLTGPELPGAG
jgi:hypothetical protein